MRAQAIRFAATRVAETIGAVVLVLVFFSVFLGLLNAFFPSGSSLKDLMKREGIFAPAGLVEQSVRELLLSSGGQEMELTKPGALAAVLTGMRNEVKNKRADSIAWATARVGMPLYDRDAIQTLSRASALITFDEQNYLDVGENSLVIIKRLEQDPLFREKRSFLVMVDGDLRGRIAGSSQQSVHVEVATPSAVARIRSRRIPDQQAEFKITVNPDQSSTIAVYHGMAEIIAQGQTINVEANQASTVLRGQPPTSPESLPDSPVLTSPMDGSLYSYRDLRPMIRFTWAAPAGVRGYHFVLARDPSFRDLIAEERLSKASFAHGNLKEGDYYWRVSGLDDRGREGAFSPTGRLRVMRDREPPKLRVQFPPETMDRDRYTLKGITEPGARVFVGGRPVQITENGEFQYRLRLQHGINVIVVEAVDEAGNVTYRSQLVNGKF